VLGLDDGPVPVNGANGRREPAAGDGPPATAPRSAETTAEAPA